MLIFGMGLYGLFISNTPSDVSPSVDRALKGSSLFGMFALKVTANPKIMYPGMVMILLYSLDE
jgi:hypothetical protein